MRPTNADRLENLRKRRAALDAELQRLEAKQRSEDRKQDTRRKILIGAVMMQEMEAKPDNFGAWVNKLLGERLNKDRDRALFGFAPLNKGGDATP